jgi:dUTPase
MFVCVHNLGKEVFHVEPGMRLAQMIFGSIDDIRWAEVTEIKPDPRKRGNAGFGSTGR